MRKIRRFLPALVSLLALFGGGGGSAFADGGSLRDPRRCSEVLQRDYGDFSTFEGRFPSVAEAQAYYARAEALAERIQAYRDGRLAFLQAELGLTEVEVEAIRDYARYDFEDFNRILREDHATGLRSALRKDYARIDLLVEALKKLPPRPGVTYRGLSVRMPIFEKMNLAEGAIFEDAAFLSTDANPLVAVKFAEEPTDWVRSVLFEIHGKSGRDIDFISDNAPESEVVFLPGTRFKVRRHQVVQGRNILILDEV